MYVATEPSLTSRKRRYSASRDSWSGLTIIMLRSRDACERRRRHAEDMLPESHDARMTATLRLCDAPLHDARFDRGECFRYSVAAGILDVDAQTTFARTHARDPGVLGWRQTP